MSQVDAWLSCMDYTDSILIKLTDPAQRSAIFDTPSLGQMAAAAYDTDTMGLEGPYSAVFDELRLGYSVSPLTTLDGSWCPTGGTEKVDVRLLISGMSAALRVDALWKGDIIATSALATDTIGPVKTTPTSWTSIDSDIIAARGALPADPAALEKERRTRLLTRIKTGFSHPEAVTDQMLDQWLASIGVKSVGQLLTQTSGTVEGEAIQITITPGQPPQKSPKALPIVAAILIRDAGFSLADLLFQSKTIKELMESAGFTSPEDRTLRVKQNFLVVWIIPGKVFDDAGWPGGDGLNGQAFRDARRNLAGKWLGQEGIGLVVTA